MLRFRSIGLLVLHVTSTGAHGDRGARGASAERPGVRRGLSASGRRLAFLLLALLSLLCACRATHKMLCGLVFHVRPASTARASSLELTPASLAGPQHPPPHRRHRRDACESPSRTSLLRDTALTARTHPQYYNWPALSTRTFATDLASVSQYVGAVSGAAATAVFIILVFLRGGIGSCTTLTAGLAAVRPDLPPSLSGRFAVHAR